VVPPDPVRRDATHASPARQTPHGTPGLWAVARVGALALAALAILLSPLLAILAAKALRRRARRRVPDAASRVVGGWDEYVDAAVDHGMPEPGDSTRAELAAQHASAPAAALAAVADRAVFSDAALSDDEAAEFWRIVDSERRRFAASLPLWRRVPAALSLRSLLRGLKTAGARPRRARKTEGRGPGSAGA